MLNPDGQTDRWVDTITLTVAFQNLLTFLIKDVCCQKDSQLLHVLIK